MPRVLGVDYGERKVGLAVSDPLKIIAGPLATERVSSMAEAAEKVLGRASEYDVELILVGYPWNLKGEKSRQTLRVDTFIEMLRTDGRFPVEIWDESFSSERAKDILIAKGIKTGHNKTKVDEMAARIILQEYLDSK